MALKKNHKGIESLKSRYALMFISPWIVGMVLFFIYPILQSIYYTFADIEISENGVISSFVGLTNFNEILVNDPDYLDNLLASFSSMLVSLPFILIVSMVLALLLNGKYAGRTFFRGLYFIPVIFSCGVVLQLFLEAGANGATQTDVSSTVSFNMIDFGEVLAGLNLPDSVESSLMDALNNIFLLVWQSGIQTVLLIAGLQSIPDTLYEVAKVEGTTKWEEFWLITFPMLMRTMFLVIIFTVIELVSSTGNLIVQNSYTQFNLMEYGLGTAMLWFYFMFVGIFVLLLFALYNKVFVRKWG